VTVSEDPTRQDDAADIRPLETPEGLTWAAAGDPQPPPAATDASVG
jgi:hypothetical protein